MYDKNSGRSRGFGFVNFSNDHEAKCAKDAMDGKVQPYSFKNMSVIAVRNEALTYINSTGNARAAIANKFCSWKSPWRINYCSSTFYGEKKKLTMTCSFVHFVTGNRSTPAINKLVFRNIASTGLLSFPYIKSF